MSSPPAARPKNSTTWWPRSTPPAAAPRAMSSTSPMATRSTTCSPPSMAATAGSTLPPITPAISFATPPPTCRPRFSRRPGGFAVRRLHRRPGGGQRMAATGGGTIVFTGATASIKARPPFRLRGGEGGVARGGGRPGPRIRPKGRACRPCHHRRRGRGAIRRKRLPKEQDSAGENELLSPAAIAEAYWQLHLQHPSAWSLRSTCGRLTRYFDATLHTPGGAHIRRFDMAIEGGCYCGEIRYVSEQPAQGHCNAIAGNASTSPAATRTPSWWFPKKGSASSRVNRRASRAAI